MTRKHDIEKITVINTLLKRLGEMQAKTNYEKGIVDYAGGMLEELCREIELGNAFCDCSNSFTFRKSLLMGAEDSWAYNNGGHGVALASNYEIAKKLSSPEKFAELEQKNYFSSRWIDVQGEAISSAVHILVMLYNAVDEVDTGYGY